MAYAGFVLPYSGATVPGFNGVLSLQTTRPGVPQELFRAQETFGENIKKEPTRILRKIDYIIYMLYIYQFPDWTNFRYDAKRVLDTLGKACYKEGKLAGLLEICGSTDFENAVIAEDIVANFAIDGHALDIESVKAEVSKRSQGATPYIKNFLGAIANSTSTLTQERLLGWHSAMGNAKTHGFRDTPSMIEAGDGLQFTGPGCERLQNEMTNFFEWFEKSDMDGTIKSIIAQFWFLTLRPFENRNGRLARILTTMLLCRGRNSAHLHYALNSQILEKRDEYLRILNKTQCGSGDLTEWIVWFLQQIEGAVEASTARIEAEIGRARFASRHSDISTGERGQVLLKAALDGGIPKEFTAKDVAALFGTSHDTALREIQSLIAKGLLRASAKGGRSQRYSVVD